MPRESDTVFAIDIGGSHISGGLCSPEGFQLLLEKRRAPHEPVGSVSSFVQELVDLAGDDPPNGLGIALAGVVDSSFKNVVASENLGRIPANLAEVIEEDTGLLTWLETDVFCLGRALAHDAPTGTFLVIAVGTGIGHCIVLDGAIRPGRGRHANRFGHIKADYGDGSCYCGQSGCVCQYSAGPVLLAASQTTEGRARAHDMLARALATAIQIVSPDEIILAGGPVEAGAFDPSLLSAMTGRYCEPWLIPPVRVLRDRSAIYRGAALIAIENSLTNE